MLLCFGDSGWRLIGSFPDISILLNNECKKMVFLVVFRDNQHPTVPQIVNAFIENRLNQKLQICTRLLKKVFDFLPFIIILIVQEFQSAFVFICLHIQTFASHNYRFPFFWKRLIQSFFCTWLIFRENIVVVPRIWNLIVRNSQNLQLMLFHIDPQNQNFT